MIKLKARLIPIMMQETSSILKEVVISIGLKWSLGSGARCGEDISFDEPIFQGIQHLYLRHRAGFHDLFVIMTLRQWSL